MSLHVPLRNLAFCINSSFMLRMCFVFYVWSRRNKKTLHTNCMVTTTIFSKMSQHLTVTENCLVSSLLTFSILLDWSVSFQGYFLVQICKRRAFHVLRLWQQTAKIKFVAKANNFFSSVRFSSMAYTMVQKFNLSSCTFCKYSCIRLENANLKACMLFDLEVIPWVIYCMASWNEKKN